jgi:hypothetical protein
LVFILYRGFWALESGAFVRNSIEKQEEEEDELTHQTDFSFILSTCFMPITKTFWFNHMCNSPQ